MDISIILFHNSKEELQLYYTSLLKSICNFISLPLYGTLQYCTFGITKKRLLPFFYLSLHIALYSLLLYTVRSIALLPI